MSNRQKIKFSDKHFQISTTWETKIYILPDIYDRDLYFIHNLI